MNGWLIFGGIVLLLILLFEQSVTVTATYEEKLDVKVKFLFFTLYPTKPKKKRSPKRRKEKAADGARTQTRETDGKETPPEEAGEGESENAEAPTDGTSSAKKAKKLPKKKKGKGRGLTFDEIMEYVRSASPPLKRLFKKIRCRDLTIRYVVATDDAAKTAIKYGAVCAALYPVIEWLTTYFSVKAREVRVEADFSKKEDSVFAHGKIKLRLSTALGCVLWLGFRVAKTYVKFLPKSKQAKPDPKLGSS